MNRRAVILLALGAAAVGTVFVGTRSSAPPSAEPFIAWAKQHAFPLVTAEPGHGFADLQPFKPIIGRARVVGVGEATHGTREFFRFKHRMLEFLVEEMGFTAFALEAGFAEARRIDDYVRGGPGDAARLVRDMGYWIWDTEEMVALVTWLRQHNAKPTTTRPVGFHGFDMQAIEGPLRDALAYLQTVDAGQVPTYAPLTRQAPAFDRGNLYPEAAALLALAQRLVEGLDKNRARYSAASGERAWRVARQSARIVQQSLGWTRRETDRERDSAMAENVLWLLQEEGAAGRVMLWAHNGHLHRAPPMRIGTLYTATWGWSAQGAHLRQSLGADYVVIGTAFNHGTFYTNPRRTNYTVARARPETFDGVLARVGPPIFALDLGRPAEDAAVARWLESGHYARRIGTRYLPPEDDDANRFKVVPRDFYDAVVFFDQTHPVRPNPRTK